jgi:Protein of unknown function (DUF2971)
MTPPQFLYKYEAFSTQSLLNLKRQILHFGSPLNFNDPYDCALTPNIVNPTDSEVFQLRDSYLKNDDVPDSARRAFETTSVSELRAVITRAAEAGFQRVVQEFLATRGVTCFSEKNDDLLMWSHYGGKYKGFCLEFDTSAEPFRKIHPVRYVQSVPPITIAQALLDPEFHPILELFCTKAEAWQYEAEWRAIHATAGTQFAYPASALKGIYFGPDIDQQSMEVVCLVLAGQNETVQLWRGHRSTREFKVNFEPFTYTSHLEAKRRGLIK